MLRRNSSNRLSHRKSLSSAHSRHESFDPEVARQYAHAAATLAFVRAQERQGADMGHRSKGVERSHATMSHRDQYYNFQVGQTAQNVVRRQQSVRFVGPNAVHERPTIGTRALQNRYVPRPAPASLRPTAITTNDAVPAEYRPPSRSSSIGKASIGNTADGFSTNIAAYNECYTQEDDAASTPSSYRRIRRSKSMFSPLKAPNVFYTNGTPERPTRGLCSGAQSTADSRTPQMDQAAAALRAPKSMSFLRGGRDHLTPGLRQRNDEAVQMARDRFFHQAAQQRLQEQPSFLFRSRAQRREKPFRQSVRTCSTNSYGSIPIASANQPEQLKESKLRRKARRASKSIKERLRRAFGRSKDGPVEVPGQQVDVNGTHVRRYPGQSEVTNGSFDKIPRPDRTTLQQVASRPPSMHPAELSQDLKSYAGSVTSLKSGHSDDKSRVTSWNSTGVNTVASHGVRLQSERDLQRLSIINENGTHVPSSSFNRQKLSNQFSAYPIIHRPNKSPSHVSHPPPALVDSARVYSALMKRLDDKSPKAKLQADKTTSLESVNVPKCFPPRTSSVHSSRASRTPATIRKVPESTSGSENGGSTNNEHQWVKADTFHSARAETVFGYTGTHAHQWVPTDALPKAPIRDQDDVFSPKNLLAREYSVQDRKENASINRSLGRSASAATQDASIRTSYYTVPESIGLTPQEIATRNEPLSRSGTTIRETKSTFFGGSSYTIARTQSPFRRALAEVDYNANGGVPISLDAFPMPNHLYTQPKIRVVTDLGIDNLVDADKTDSESVYSRTTSGQAPAAANSRLTLPLPEEDVSDLRFQDTSKGDILILDRATYRPAMVNSQGHRATSSASSTEWKKWMSSEVTKLERGKDHNAASYINYALPTMPRSFKHGHVRESAQINDDDTDIAQNGGNAIKQPLGLIPQKVVAQSMQQSLQNLPVLRPILKHSFDVSLIEKAGAANNVSSSAPVPPAPPIPPRSPFRPKQSQSSLRSIKSASTLRTVHKQSLAKSVGVVPGVVGKNLLHKRNSSQTTLRSTKSLETPAKLVVKRTARKPSNTPFDQSPGEGLVVSVNKQFGNASTGTRLSAHPASSSACRESTSLPQQSDIYGSDGAGLMGPAMIGAVQELDAQQMGSKRMVDLFLSSRRKRIASEGESEHARVFI